MVKLLLSALILGALASVGRVGGDETLPTICAECTPSMPSITTSLFLKLDVSGLHNKKGSCTKDVIETSKCKVQVAGCQFWGKIILVEFDAQSNANPTPPAVPGVSVGWTQTSANPGHRKWEVDYGSAGAETVIACGADDPYALQVIHNTSAAGNPQVTDHPKAGCGKCPDS
ncbi:MAG: hypothetical protein NT107_03290 [Planctomycetota bacterium]|nr:hypothetical protein [Planctomycetota bacterium]